MANAEIIKETFLIELKDVTGDRYYMRIETAGEAYIEGTMLTIFDSRFVDSFIKVYTDTDCRFEYRLRKSSVIGYRVVLDLMAG